MEQVFIELLNMSITASWLVLAIVIFRLIFKKAPKALNVVLWGLVAIRLVVPFSVESILSLVPSTETIPQDIIMSNKPTIYTGIHSLNSTINPIISETLAPKPEDSVNPMQVITFIAAWIWIIGMVMMVVYTCISYWNVYRKTKESIRIQENVWMCDRIDTPFIFGIIKPRIYLPSAMSKQDIEYVIAHEHAHLKRYDHWWKPFGFALLTVYWFNPILWIAYVLLCRDIELACDEKVIKEMGIEIKKPYSDALINCSVSRRTITACPLAFGEVGVKERVKTVLNYKKPAFWIIVVAVVACVVVAVCFLTNPKKSDLKSMQMKIAYTLPSCIVFEDDCFYAFDEDGHQYRVIWNDFTGLNENDMILVEYDKIRILEYPDGYPTGRNPKYEMEAVSVGSIDDINYEVENTGKNSYTLETGIYLAGVDPIDYDDTSSNNVLGQYFYLDTEKNQFHMGQSIAMSYAIFGTYEFDGKTLTLSVDKMDNSDVYVLRLNENGSFIYDEEASKVSVHNWFNEDMAFGLMPEFDEEEKTWDGTY